MVLKDKRLKRVGCQSELSFVNAFKKTHEMTRARIEGGNDEKFKTVGGGRHNLLRDHFRSNTIDKQRGNCERRQ